MQKNGESQSFLLTYWPLLIHFLQLLTEAGEVRVGQSVAFLTAAAVTPNELMNAIADATRMQPTAALMIQAN